MGTYVMIVFFNNNETNANFDKYSSQNLTPYSSKATKATSHVVFILALLQKGLQREQAKL